MVMERPFAGFNESKRPPIARSNRFLWIKLRIDSVRGMQIRRGPSICRILVYKYHCLAFVYEEFRRGKTIDSHSNDHLFLRYRRFVIFFCRKKRCGSQKTETKDEQDNNDNRKNDKWFRHVIIVSWVCRQIAFEAKFRKFEANFSNKFCGLSAKISKEIF